MVYPSISRSDLSYKVHRVCYQIFPKWLLIRWLAGWLIYISVNCFIFYCKIISSLSRHSNRAPVLDTVIACIGTGVCTPVKSVVLTAACTDMCWIDPFAKVTGTRSHTVKTASSRQVSSLWSRGPLRRNKDFFKQTSVTSSVTFLVSRNALARLENNSKIINIEN